MSNSQDNKYEKILDYLEVLTKSLNEFKSDVDRRFDAVEKRFDAVDEDMGTLKGTTRRIEERQALAEKGIGILQDADRARAKMTSGSSTFVSAVLRTSSDPIRHLTKRPGVATNEDIPPR